MANKEHITQHIRMQNALHFNLPGNLLSLHNFKNLNSRNKMHFGKP